jgi:hypothetical protein
MKELLDLKARFGMPDPRQKDPSTFTCNNDFLTRVGDVVATKGRVQRDGGIAPAPQTSAQGGLEQAIAALAPQGYGEADIEQLVQVITDQIMASAR